MAIISEADRQSHEWLRAAADVARSLITEPRATLLAEIVATARAVSRSDHCALLLPTADGGMQVSLADGAAASAYLGHVFAPDSGQLGAAVQRGKSLLIEHLSANATRTYPDGFVFGPTMLVPLVDMVGVRGAFLFVRNEGTAPFDSVELDLATTFATQVAVALELADARADAESLRVLRDRHRIAKDLHDNVMQRLFGAGIGLQMIDMDALPLEVAERLHNHMTELDDTIRQIRTTIFELRESDDVDRVSVTHLTRGDAGVAGKSSEEAQ